MSEKDLSQIEETIAYQEQQISDLSEVVTKQWDEIEILKRRLGRMQGKIEELEEGARGTEGETGVSVSEQAARDKPPHY